MNPTRTWITGVAFLATFLWLMVPDLKASPAVLWPSVLAVGLAFVTRDLYLSLMVLLAAGGLACWLLVRYRGQRVEEASTLPPSRRAPSSAAATNSHTKL